MSLRLLQIKHSPKSSISASDSAGISALLGPSGYACNTTVQFTVHPHPRTLFTPHIHIHSRAHTLHSYLEHGVHAAVNMGVDAAMAPSVLP